MRTRVRAGDPEAFAELFDGYTRTVYNHAFRLTGDWSVAEDVMSATFLEAWRLHGTVEPEGGSLRPWLLGVATNLARNHCRSNRRYRAAAAAAAAAVPLVPDHADEVAGRRTEWIFDSATLAFLGERTVQVEGTSGEGLIKPGTVVFTHAVMTRAIVDRIKQTPAQAG